MSAEVCHITAFIRDWPVTGWVTTGGLYFNWKFYNRNLWHPRTNRTERPNRFCWSRH